MPAKAKKAQASAAMDDLFDVTGKLRTAACVPALREAVKAWRAGKYKGATDTTKLLLQHWFQTDHRLANGARFRWHDAQREAIETLVFVWESEKVRTRKALYQRYAAVDGIPFPLHDDFARYCVKMATGSGKTKVMSLVVAWQHLNAQREAPETAKEYANTFLLLAPNVIVLERLRTDFAGGRIFEADPIIPKPLRMFWDFDVVLRGEGEKAHAAGTLFLTNIQQFYDRPEADKEPEAMTAVMGSPPPVKKLELTDFGDRIALRSGNLVVLNDEAHHTWDEESEWNKVIRALHVKTPLAAQVDFSATPRFDKGALFPWTVSDYPLKQAIVDRLVKRPMRGVAKISEATSSHASVRYAGFLKAGVERWKEYRDQLLPLGKKPVLFVMLSSTEEADDVADWLRTKYPELLGGEKTLVIHTNTKGEIVEKDLAKARDLARKVDEDESPVHAIVSVLMLREGWDVQNVTVVVGLRPYSAAANILPEQTVGRGLRLMFRGQPAAGYPERVDIIGNQKFLEFVDDLERIEDVKFGTFGKEDKVRIDVIQPLAERAKYDIGLPSLSPSLVRKKSLAQEIAELDVAAMEFPPIPMERGSAAEKTFKYEGYDVITLQKELEREYTFPEPQTAQEVIGYYARRIAEALRLPAQFAALAPKVKEFFEKRAFGRPVELSTPGIVSAMSTPVAAFVTIQTFRKALASVAVEEKEPVLLTLRRLLSTCPPFPWSQVVLEAGKTVFNLVACDNDFERDFARFLDRADDVAAFAKLPMKFGFTLEYLDGERNLRLYSPDFVAIDAEGGHWLLETKGAETVEVQFKDRAARAWCGNATKLAGIAWRYRKVPQDAFESLQPTALAHLAAIGQGDLFPESPST